MTTVKRYGPIPFRAERFRGDFRLRRIREGGRMAYNEKLAAEVRAILGDLPGLSEQVMFGGLSFLLHGHMCCGVLGEELVVRVGMDQYVEALRRPHAREMDFTGKPMRGFVQVGARGLRNGDAMREWVALGTAFVMTLPPK